jgi:hypothetical protein
MLAESVVSNRVGGLAVTRALVGLSGPWGSGCACLFAEVVCSSSSSVAGRLAFPASSSTLRFPVGPRGLPSAVVTMVAHRPALSVFASPSVPSSRTGWSSQPSSLGFHAPFRRHASKRPLPEPTRRSTPSAPGCHTESPVPSSWFPTTSTASSAPSSRACCIPLPTLGFAAFPSSACPVPPKRHLGMRTLFPATHTPRRTSSSSAVPRHRGHFLPAVSSLERSTFAGAADET